MTREEAAKILYQEKSNAGWMRWVGFPVDKAVAVMSETKEARHEE